MRNIPRIYLPKAISRWQSPDFKQVLKNEIEELDSRMLPLQQGLSHSSYVSQDKITVMILQEVDEGNSILIRGGVFYSGIVAGCNCSDDPTLIDRVNEYCELQFVTDKNTAETVVTLLEGEKNV